MFADMITCSFVFCECPPEQLEAEWAQAESLMIKLSTLCDSVVNYALGTLLLR